MLGSVGAGLGLQVRLQPVSLELGLYQRTQVFGQCLIVEEGGRAGGTGVAGGRKLHELHLAGEGTPGARGIGTTILNGVFQVEERPHLVIRVVGIDQDGSLTQQCPVALKCQVDDGVHQGVAGTDKLGRRFARHVDGFLVKGDALVAAQDVPEAGHAAATANEGRDVGDLVAPGLTRVQRASEMLKGGLKEGGYEMGLQSSSLSPLEVLANLAHAGGVHHVAGQGPVLKQFPHPLLVGQVVHGLKEAGSDLGLVAVPNGLN